MRKKAELKFKVLYTDKSQSRKINENGGIPFKALKALFMAVVKPQNDTVVELIYGEDSLIVRYIVRQNSWDIASFVIYRPKSLPPSIFKSFFQKQGFDEDLIVIPF